MIVNKNNNKFKIEIMKITKLLSMTFVAISLFGGNLMNAQMAEKTVMVGGAEMYPSKNIVENAINSKDHTTLVAAVKAADLVDVLMSEGPFTVFAPTNDAFNKLPEGTVATLVKPENKETLQAILTYHVVAGKWDAQSLVKMINDGKGKAVLTTVNGEMLTAWKKGKNVYVSDSNGNKAKVTISNVFQSNGLIHVIDTVLLPKA
jgi:uncharacterized surface protein with fasciclin (FAS1) repeats